MAWESTGLPSTATYLRRRRVCSLSLKVARFNTSRRRLPHFSRRFNISNRKLQENASLRRRSASLRRRSASLKKRSARSASLIKTLSWLMLRLKQLLEK